MDRIRISGTEPSLVILRQRKYFKMLKSDSQKMPKTKWGQKGWCNKHIKLNFQSILNTENFDALKNATNQLESTAEHGYMCHRGLSGPPAVTITK